MTHFSNRETVSITPESIHSMVDEMKRWANSDGTEMLESMVEKPIIPMWVQEKLDRGEITEEQIRNVWAYGIPNPTDEQLTDYFTRLGVI